MLELQAVVFKEGSRTRVEDASMYYDIRSHDPSTSPQSLFAVLERYDLARSMDPLGYLH